MSRLRRLLLGPTLVAVFLGTGFAQSAGAQVPVQAIQPVRAVDVQPGARVSASAGGKVGFARDLTMRWGRFYVSPGFGIGVGADASVNAVSETGTTTLNPRFFFDAGPSLDIVLPAGRQHTLSVTGSAFYRYFLGDQRERTNGWNYTATAGYQFRSRVVTAQATYMARQNQETLIDFLEQGATVGTSEFADRVQVLRLSPAAQLSVNVGPRTSFVLSGILTDTRYAEDEEFGDVVAQELDRTETIARASLQRRTGGRTTVSLIGDLQRTDYRQEQSFRDNWRYRGGVRADFGNQLAQDLSGSLEAGVESRQVSGDLASHTGPYTLGVVRYRAFPRMGLWLRGEVRTSPTIWENNVYLISEGAGTGLDYWVTRAVNVGIFVDYSQIRYPEEVTAEQDDGTFFTGKRRDSLVVYRGDVTLRVLGRAISIQGGYFDRGSNFDVALADGFFIRLGLSMFLSRDF